MIFCRFTSSLTILHHARPPPMPPPVFSSGALHEQQQQQQQQSQHSNQHEHVSAPRFPPPVLHALPSPHSSVPYTAILPYPESSGQYCVHSTMSPNQTTPTTQLSSHSPAVNANPNLTSQRTLRCEEEWRNGEVSRNFTARNEIQVALDMLSDIDFDAAMSLLGAQIELPPLPASAMQCLCLRCHFSLCCTMHSTPHQLQCLRRSLTSTTPKQHKVSGLFVWSRLAPLCSPPLHTTPLHTTHCSAPTGSDVGGVEWAGAVRSSLH